MEHLVTDNKAYLPLIIEKLKTVGIHKIILFGSLAYGEVRSDSDIDLIVVTNDDYLPKSYKEKSDIYLKISSVLDDIVAKTPIDLIVYTKPMYSKFNKLGALFSKEVSKKGIVLYEVNN